MMIEAGLEYSRTYKVEEQHSAISVGSGEVDVLSTPSMIAFVEETCRLAVKSYLRGSKTTVGFKIEFLHLKPVPIGRDVEVKCSLAGVEDRKLTFYVEVYSCGVLVGKGYHTRYVVDIEDFLSKLHHVECR